MPLTKYERKEKLGYGAVKQIAKVTKRTEGHVSQVINGKRSDLRVERVVASRLNVTIEEAFPEYHVAPATV